MKLTKILPVILLALVLAWLFLPGTNNAPPAPTPTAALTLVSPSPTAAPTPASSAPAFAASSILYVFHPLRGPALKNIANSLLSII